MLRVPFVSFESIDSYLMSMTDVESYSFEDYRMEDYVETQFTDDEIGDLMKAHISSVLTDDDLPWVDTSC